MWLIAIGILCVCAAILVWRSEPEPPAQPIEFAPRYYGKLITDESSDVHPLEAELMVRSDVELETLAIELEAEIASDSSRGFRMPLRMRLLLARSLLAKRARLRRETATDCSIDWGRSAAPRLESLKIPPPN